MHAKLLARKRAIEIFDRPAGAANYGRVGVLTEGDVNQIRALSAGLPSEKTILEGLEQ